MKYTILTLLTLIIYSNSQSQVFVPYMKDKFWGYKDQKGNIKIEAQYQWAWKFQEGVGVAVKNNKCGAIDQNNNIVIPFNYDFLRPLDSSEFLFAEKIPDSRHLKYGVMDWKQNVKIAPTYNYITKFENGYRVSMMKDIAVADDPVREKEIFGFEPPPYLKSFSTENYDGFLDTSGKEVIPCKYKFLDIKNDSLIVVTNYVNGQSAEGLFNIKGEALTGLDYIVIGRFNNGLAKVRIGDYYGYMNTDGKIVIPIEYEFCEEFKNGYALFNKDGKWGAFDTQGRVAYEPIYYYGEMVEKIKKLPEPVSKRAF